MTTSAVMFELDSIPTLWRKVMESFRNSMQKIVQYSCYVAAAAVLVWLIMPTQRIVVQGFLLGLFVSAWNGYILYVKTKRVGEAALDPSKKARGIGMLQRMLLAGFAVYVSTRMPHLFSVYGVFAGLFVVQLISLFTVVAHSKS